MKKHMMMLALAAAMVTGAGAAEAQDWRSGLYIKGSAGWNHTRDQDYGNVKTDLENGYAISGAVGYDYGDFRTEFEVTHRENDVDGHRVPAGALANAGGDLSSTAFMFNGYYDIPTGTPFTPYVGAGIGVAKVNVENYSTNGVRFADDDDTVFAYQGIVGAEYAATDKVSLFTEYKYFATSDVDVGATDADYRNHAIMAGVKYSLN